MDTVGLSSPTPTGSLGLLGWAGNQGNYLSSFEEKLRLHPRPSWFYLGWKHPFFQPFVHIMVSGSWFPSQTLGANQDSLRDDRGLGARDLGPV